MDKKEAKRKILLFNPNFYTDGSPRQTGYFISSESSRAPETLPNNALHGLLRQVKQQKTPDISKWLRSQGGGMTHFN